MPCPPNPACWCYAFEAFEEIPDLPETSGSSRLSKLAFLPFVWASWNPPGVKSGRPPDENLSSAFGLSGCQVTSKPPELEKVDRRVLQLEMERVSIGAAPFGLGGFLFFFLGGGRGPHVFGGICFGGLGLGVLFLGLGGWKASLQCKGPLSTTHLCH